MANVIITGANRGVGLALVKAYAQDCRVFAWCRDPEAAIDLKRLADVSEGRIVLVQADLTDPPSIDRAVSLLRDVPIDVLLNVAGLFIPGNLGDRNFDAWYVSFEVMAIGPFRVAQALLPNLEKAHGKIITVTSQMGASTWSTGGDYPYVAAKAALNRIMKTMAIDLKQQEIPVAVVHPGHVRTRMGGEAAPIGATESAQGIRAFAEALSLERTGCFVDWNGSERDW